MNKPIYSGEVAAVQYHNHKDCNISVGTKLQLKAEPTNEFDKNAIAIYCGDTKIGYVRKAHTEKLHPILSKSVAIVTDYNKNGPTHNMIKFIIMT